MSTLIKQAAKRLQEAYQAQLPKSGDKTAPVKISHKSDAEGYVTITLSGPKSIIDDLHGKLAAAPADGLIAQPDNVLIHSTLVDLKDGPKTEKEEDQTHVLTINHAITTF